MGLALAEIMTATATGLVPAVQQLLAQGYAALVNALARRLQRVLSFT